MLSLSCALRLTPAPCLQASQASELRAFGAHGEARCSLRAHACAKWHWRNPRRERPAEAGAKEEEDEDEAKSRKRGEEERD